MAFAVENGFMTKEDGERMKEMHNMTGPGGCKGEECRLFCEDPANREGCQSFAGEHDFLNRGPDHPVGQDRAMEQRGFEIPPGREECKKDPQACQQRFQQENGPRGMDADKFMNMSEEERARFMQAERAQNMHDFQGRPESKPYQPEGLLPMEAFRSDKDHNGMKPQEPGLDATPEELRVYQKNIQNSKEFQTNPEKYNPMPPGRDGTPPMRPGEQGQYQQQYQQQYEQQSQHYQPAQGEFRPPEGMQFQGPPPNNSMPPPPGESMPPPSGDMGPQSMGTPESLLAAVGSLLKSLFGF